MRTLFKSVLDVAFIEEKFIDIQIAHGIQNSTSQSILKAQSKPKYLLKEVNTFLIYTIIQNQQFTTLLYLIVYFT